MAEQNLTLNLINFYPEEKEKEFSFLFEKKEGLFPIAKKEFPKNISDIFTEEQLEGVEHLYTDFTATGDETTTLKVDMMDSKKFAKHYYNFLINNYFKSKQLITNSNFIHDTEVWIENKKDSDKDFTAYSIYVVKVQIARVSREPELVLSYDGVSKVFNKSLEELDFDTTLYNWCIFKNELYKYEEIPQEAKYNLSQVFPVLNNGLKRAMNLPTVGNLNKHKYKDYHTHISAFYDTYLNSAEFKEIIPTDAKGFLKVDKAKIKFTTPGSNQLLFGQGQTNLNPYYGLKENGPHTITPLSHIKFIFIYHSSDKDFANDMHLWFEGKKTGFSGLKKFCRLNYSIDTTNSIKFENADNPVEEVREQLFNQTRDDKTQYIAVYISPISKDETDPEKHSVYYLIKEELLKYGITSQVIDKVKIHKEGFNFSLPNIAIAILAKLKGVPWRLHRTIANELIVGIGAFKNTTFSQKFLGSAFCFSNDGQFKGFDCFSETDHFMLAGSIQKAVRKFASENKEVKRLIIHFYKEMSNEELKPIKQNLYDLNLDIPVFIVTINKTESKDIVLFDTKHTEKMPVSGTFVNIGWNQFLLCNNTRYGTTATEKIDGYPFPVRIKISSSKKELLEDYELVKDLVDQVYQFSRMYWKSVKQQNLPVTIKYPEMVAQIFPYFESKTIPAFGKDNLWFL